ncbi:hypothetical protein [Paraburkholderia sp. Cpub6]|uniref:hypothetical protein n=1 Tax=Paraburkholderia sp. Cpub6 TaxID=2723094 RepID=UPI0016105C76|nr:hypothetical protein [Paraburkholderia sp. Cpub6]MBB5456902.1 hypothetical protein [Paraburkholderia sp. Cpub6]
MTPRRNPVPAVTDAPGLPGDEEQTQRAVSPDVTALLQQILEGIRATSHDPADEPGAMTQKEFCERYRLDRVTLYHLRRKGLGPEVMMVGKKILITYRAALDWQHAMIKATPKPAQPSGPEAAPKEAPPLVKPKKAIVSRVKGKAERAGSQSA